LTAESSSEALRGGQVTNTAAGLCIGQLPGVLCAHDSEGRSDGQLLERFLTHQDDAAFAALVRSHGPMVLGVCRRILGNVADAEDAFQATFLVLVRRAHSLVSRSVVGDWLHGVARHTALKALAAAACRRTKEQAMARPEATAADVRNDWLPVLDDELARLPEKYRLPIVLCDLEGKKRREAAEQLGWPEGTVAGRLARAKTLLAKRLARRGLVLSGGTLAVALAENAASACVPVSLLVPTVKAATCFAGRAAAAGSIAVNVSALTEGVLQAMFLSKLKTVALVLAVLLLSGVAALSSGRLAFGQKDEKADPAKRPAAKADDRPKKVEGDLEKLQGTWRELVFEQDGLRVDEEMLKKVRVVVAGNTIQFGDPRKQFRFKLDPSKRPKEIQFSKDDEAYQGIYDLTGDDLKLCYVTDREPKLPTEFTVPQGSERRLIILKRDKDGQGKEPVDDKKSSEAPKDQWGLTTQGLQMSVSVTGKDKGGNPEFQVAIRNVGEQDVTVNLGMMLANGKVQLPDHIRLKLSDDKGKTRELHFSDKRHPGIAGRVDDYFVPLRVGSVYTLKLPLSQFWCPATKEFTVELKPGKYRVSAHFEGTGAKHDSGKFILNFWEGKLQSNTSPFEQ
jgi:RNA polymerase sigma factor (sigma-70 family)